MVFKLQNLFGKKAAAGGESAATIADLPGQTPQAFAMLPDGKKVRDPLSTHYRVDDEQAIRLKELRNENYRKIDPGWTGPTDAMELKNHALDPDHVPKYGVFKKSLPKIVQHYDRVAVSSHFGGFFTIVTPQWKASVEAVEPGRHQFFPFEIRCEDGRPVEQRYIFNLFQRLPCIDRPASGYIRHARDDGTHYWAKPFVYSGAAMENRLVLRRKSIAGHHLWFDADEQLLFVSPALEPALRPLMPVGLDLFAVIVR